MMLKNFIKGAIRKTLRNKTYSLINVLGLAIGISTCILITLYVKDELTFDAYHRDANRIYRVCLQINEPEHGEATFARSSLALTHALKTECPTVEATARFTEIGGVVVKNGNGDLFFEKTSIYAIDSDLFEVLTIPFIHGNAQTAFSQPDQIVISEKTALKYFGRTDVQGEFLFFNQNMREEASSQRWQISGVFQEIPPNSHLPHFKILLPMKSTEDYSDEAWELSSAATYIKVTRNTNIEVLEKEINQIASQYNSDPLKRNHASHHYFLQSIRDIHLYSDFRWEYASLGNMKEILVFSIIAILILCIACLNFINLSTAQCSSHVKEIAVRKAVGAHRSAIIYQFITESALTMGIAFCIAIVIVEILLPTFNAYLGKNLKVDYFSNQTVIVSMLIMIILTFITSIFPAFLLASFKPTVILKGVVSMKAIGRTDNSKNKSNLLRTVLVVSQFSVSLILIISSLCIYRQILFMKNKDLGFHKDQMLVIPTQGIKMSESLYTEYESIKSELMQHHTVVSVTKQTAAPGRDKFYEKIKLVDTGNSVEIFSSLEFIDADYLKTYDIPVIAGGTIQKDRLDDRGEAFILNETAAKGLGFSTPDEAIHKRLAVMFWQGEIIAVVKDFHFSSLHQKIAPLVCFSPRFNPEYFTIRLNTQNMSETLTFLKQKWATFFPNNPFEYYFLDKDFNSFYRAEEKLNTLIFIFTVLTIFIACLGLYGLVSFTTERRTKEIGIRKVFGASTPGITTMLATELLRGVVLANMFAWPAAYILISKWLQHFAYHINITWWVFIAAGMLTLLVVLLTVSWQTIKAATVNPIESLRYE